MFLEGLFMALDTWFDLRDFSQYDQHSARDDEQSRKKQALKFYDAEQQIKNESNPNRKDKMQYLLNLGITDFSGI